jgi:hypothetical protein
MKSKLNIIIFVVLLVSLLLNVIVAIGNWNLYGRMEKVESMLGLQATQQSRQTASQGLQR